MAVSLINTANVTDNGTVELGGAYGVTSATVGGTTYLFATGHDDNGVSVFATDANGTLTNVFNVTDAGALQLSGATGLATAVVEGTTYLFVAGFNDGGVSAFSVAGNGALTNVANFIDSNTTLAGAVGVTTALVGGTTYLFVAGVTDDGVTVFSVGTNGALTVVDSVVDGEDGDYELDGVHWVDTALVGGTTFLFAAGFVDNGVSVFSVAANGQLTNVANVADDATLQLAEAAHVETAEVGGTTYLFVAGAGDGGVSVFSVDGSGQLTNVDNVTDDGTLQLAGAHGMTTMVLDGTTYLVVAGRSDWGLAVFSVDNGGALTSVTNVADDGTLNLGGVVRVASAVVDGQTLVFSAAYGDDGVSGFRVSSTPTLADLDSSVTFLENTVNAAPQILDGDVTFTDADDNFDAGTLTVTGLLPGDSVSIRDQGTGAGEIGFSGGDVSYEGTVIGGATGGTAGTDLTVTFNAAATSDALDALIQNLTYANSSDTPTASRTLTVKVIDAAGEQITFSELTGAPNPFNGIVIAGAFTAVPSLVDIDGDGDLDAFAGGVSSLRYFENTGDATTPIFTEQALPANLAFDTDGFNSPSFADIDDDGDFDAFVGDGIGNVNYYNNAGSATAPVFNLVTGNFFGTGLNQAGAGFADLDGDGDLDALVGFTNTANRYYENTGSPETPNMELRAGAADPFDGLFTDSYVKPAFHDVDGDDDLDAVVGHGPGDLRYWENTGTATAPLFVDRTGTAASPFDGISVGIASAPSLGDLDGDGDLDLVIGDVFGNLRYFQNVTPTGAKIVVNVTAETENISPSLIGLAASATFLENTVNAAPQVLDSDVTFTDPDDNFDTGSLTVTGLLPEDSVGIRNQGAGAGEIGFSGGDVSYEDTVIGAATGGTAGTDLTVTFNTAATAAAVDALIQNLTYANSSDTPGAARTLTVTVTDAAGAAVGVPIVVNITAESEGVTIVGSRSGDLVDATHTVRGQPLPTDASDIIAGNNGNDNLSGLGGDDTILGGAGIDRLYGGAGNDHLTGGEGRDILRGDDNDDTIHVAGREDQSDTIDGGSGADTLQVDGTAVLVLAGFDAAASSIEIWAGNNKSLIGTNASETFDFSALALISGLSFVDAGDGNDKVIGSGVADDLRGGRGNDSLDGGAGNDHLAGGEGRDILRGGNDNDTIHVAGRADQNDTIDGGLGTDTLQIDGTAALVLGGFDAAASSIEIWAGNNKSLTGTNASESFDLSALTSISGLPFVDAGAGNDSLIGSNVGDDLRGGRGNDTLDGGGGDDWLTGGRESDSFVFADGGGNDIVTDYRIGEDKFDLTGVAGLDDFGDLAMTQVGNSVVIDFGIGDSLTIQRTTIARLNAHQDDFLLN